MSTKNTPITVAHGDGIGPEVMEATLHILQQAGARFDIETIEIGETVYLCGNSPGIEPTDWDSLRCTALKLIIDSRGTNVYPGDPETLTGDTWRCRILPAGDASIQASQTSDLLGRIHRAGVDFIKIESLYNFNYSLGQGQ